MWIKWVDRVKDPRVNGFFEWFILRCFCDMASCRQLIYSLCAGCDMDGWLLGHRLCEQTTSFQKPMDYFCVVWESMPSCQAVNWELTLPLSMLDEKSRQRRAPALGRWSLSIPQKKYIALLSYNCLLVDCWLTSPMHTRCCPHHTR